MEGTNSQISKRNMKKKTSRDRMSDLPDCILHNIFSFLSIQHAVRFSVLSKRFRNLWKSLPYLHFDDHERLDFVEFVNKVLIQRHKSDIFRFSIDSQTAVVPNDVSPWFLAAIQSNVREMDINVHIRNDINPPRHLKSLFSCKSLTVLKLALGSGLEEINFPSSGLPNLKVLYLKDCDMPGAEEIGKFISTCYSLESLEFEELLFDDSWSPHVISNVTLESFAVRNVYESSIVKFEICAPNLRAFACHDQMAVVFSFVVVPPLSSADIDMDVDRVLEKPWEEFGGTEDDYEKLDYALLMKRLLDSVQSVQSLKLSGKVLEVAFERDDALQRQSLQFCNLKSLHLSTWLSTDCILAMLELLRISPKLETLVLHKTESKDGCLKPLNWDEVSINVDGATELCTFHRLKVLEIHDIIGSKNELKLLEIFLKNVTTLEKLIIWTSPNISSYRKKRLINFSKTLMAIPRASPSISVFCF